ncbi:hypothetical protein LG197_17630 [Pseudomonas asiatica]|uniref:hypothetical protein n=1 Tax=Pseudomonas asiatica TaxID=2219225 RepID=UPI0018AA545B|nr:hypothetical protein [Pseudomonas asiatica]MBF8806956.1 hypothetical protein [Pseudomonas asiatica]WDM86438.1 hypothetical protein LG197_17630 [Pseudomonas asiatica]
MPTENRSSNTDPRDVFIRLNPLGLGEAELRKDSTGFEDPRTHSDYLLFLAGYRETHAEPQPHPEPIAWMVGTAFWWTKEEAERDAAETGLQIVGLGPMTGAAPAEQHQGVPVKLPAYKLASQYNSHDWDESYRDGWGACRDEIAKLGPLYTHADPGEVERLRNLVELAESEAMSATVERDELRAQLAEMDALLRDFCAHSALICGDLLRLAREDDCATTEPIRARAYAAMDHSRKVKKALSASAEPSAPTPQTINGHKLNCKAVDDYKPGECSCGVEPSAPGILSRAHDVNMFQRTAEPGAKS